MLVYIKSFVKRSALTRTWVYLLTVSLCFLWWSWFLLLGSGRLLLGWGPTRPPSCNGCWGRAVRARSCIWNLILLVLLADIFRPWSGWSLLLKCLALCPIWEHPSIILSTIVVIFVRNIISFLCIFCHKVKESLIAADLDNSKLKSVPAFSENWLNVAIGHCKSIFVELSAIWTHKSSKRHVAVRWSISLAVHAPCVESIFSYLPLKNCWSLRCLWITIHRGLMIRCCRDKDKGLSHVDIGLISCWWQTRSFCHIYFLHSKIK